MVSALIIVGCSKKTDASNALVKTLQVLEELPPLPQAPAKPDPKAPTTLPVHQVSQALASLKAGNYSDTISQMESARINPNKTPQQMMAIQDAMASVMVDLYNRAANGDAAAQQAIKKYQENRNRL